jgi:hypothetical protein
VRNRDPDSLKKIYVASMVELIESQGWSEGTSLLLAGRPVNCWNQIFSSVLDKSILRLD